MVSGNGYHFGFANLETQQPYIQVNAAIAHNLPLPKIRDVEGRISVVNLFDRVYLIRQGSGIGSLLAAIRAAARALLHTRGAAWGNASGRREALNQAEILHYKLR